MAFVSGRSTRSTPGPQKDIQWPPGATFPALRQAFGGRLIVAPDLPGWKEKSVLSIKTRVGLLGVLAIFLVGAFAAGPAEAQGPYWYHRTLNGQGKGTKLGNQQTGPAFLEVAGGGGVQKLKSIVGGAEIVITANQLQAKGIIYNNPRQGQGKILLTYVEPHVEGLPSCVVTVGTNNTVPVFADVEWSWDGTSTQLHEQPQQHQKPDIVFLPKELAAGATALPKETFTTIKFAAANCGVFNSVSLTVKGSVAAELEPPNAGEWSVTQKQKVVTVAKQHFWNGTENIGVETGLFLGENAAELSGAASVKVLPRQVKQEQQEVTLWEF